MGCGNQGTVGSFANSTKENKPVKLSWKKSTGLVLVVAMFGMLSAGLQAEPSIGGKFKLPFDVKFGTITLPSGDYTFSLDHRGMVNSSFIVYRGVHAVGIVQPEQFNSNEMQNAAPVLICLRHGGNVTVRALKLPHVGTYYFPLSKDTKNVVAKNQPELLETVAIEISGK